MARDLKEFEISKQVLIYPAIDLNVKLLHYNSRIENAEGYGLEFASLVHTYNLYLTNPEDVHQTYVSPINVKEFSYLPSALVITAEYDPLRDEGELYANKLIEAGTHVEIKRYNGVIHGFLLRFKDLDEYKGIYSLIGTF
jgi:acetyl esterase